MNVQEFKVDPEGDRDAWLKLRQRDVTASVAGALLGIHPYKTRFALWHEKAGKVSEPAEETAAMLRGRILEGPALDLLRLERPRWQIIQPNVYLRDTDIRLGATPDAYAIHPKRAGLGIVQVKSVEQSVFVRVWCDDEGVACPLDRGG